MKKVTLAGFELNFQTAWNNPEFNGSYEILKTGTSRVLDTGENCNDTFEAMIILENFLDCYDEESGTLEYESFDYD